MTDETYVTKAELDTFKDALFSELERRFESFTEDFIEALNIDSEKGSNECSCDESNLVDPENAPRYILFSGGQKYFASDVKPNALVGIDFFLREIDPKTGTEYNSQGTITSSDVVILDLKPEMNLETFTAIRKQTIDWVVQKAQEAKVRGDALKNQSNQTNKDVNVNYMSYN